MAISSLCTSTSDDETKDLETLLDAFSCTCTLEDIASAYCSAGLDVNKAVGILFQLQESESHVASFEQNDEVDSLQSDEFVHEREIKHSNLLNGQSKGSKPRKISATLGTISGVLGNKYARPSSSGNVSNALREIAKPLQFETVESLPGQNIAENVVSNYIARNDAHCDKDIEEFLFSMLGEGFNLSKDVIRDVLGQCGYNIKQSTNALLKLSAKTLEKGKAIHTEGFGRSNCSTATTCLSKRMLSDSIRAQRQYNLDNSNLSNEVLQSLFSFPERLEEGPKKCLAMGLNRTRVVGQKVVTEPLDDHVFSSERIPLKEDVNSVLDEEDEYQVLRTAAKQHREAMKMYYEAAIDSFERCDNEMAKYCLEQGKYYDQKAHEADAKSNAMIVEPWKNNTNDVITLDLQNQSAKEASDLLKLHLHSLANIPPFRCLKVIVGAETEDRKQGKTRRQVIKLLQKESIKWTEVDELGTLKIQLDRIDQRKLSFAKAMEME